MLFRSQMFGIKKMQALGSVTTGMAKATKPVAQRTPAPPRPHESVAQIAAIANGIRKANPGMDEVDIQDQATRQYLALTKTGTSGAAAKNYADALKDYNSYKTLNASTAKKIIKEQFGGDENAFKDDYMARVTQGLPTDVYSAKAAAPAPKPRQDKSNVKKPPPPPGFVE